jgi:hypothetical protein
MVSVVGGGLFVSADPVVNTDRSCRALPVSQSWTAGAAGSPTAWRHGLSVLRLADPAIAFKRLCDARRFARHRCRNERQIWVAFHQSASGFVFPG